MKKDNFGALVVLINIVLTLFLLTMKEDKITYFIVCIISNIIAIIFGIFVLNKQNKKLMNVISLVINIIILVCVIIYRIYFI